MAQVGIRELLEAGVHFGHQTRRWNPKMRRFIFGERDGIYIIDLLQTERMLENARQFASEVAHRGGTVLFVGTKKQARDAIKEIAEASDMPYVNHRWLGGLLTNYQTISLRIKRLHDLERYESEGQLALLPTRERMAAQADLEKLRANLGGVKNMQRDARRGVRHRSQDRGDRGARGAAAPDPDHRARRHQLRPRRDRLCDPWQRRRDPLVRGDHPRDRRCGGVPATRCSVPRRRGPGSNVSGSKLRSGPGARQRRPPSVRRRRRPSGRRRSVQRLRLRLRLRLPEAAAATAAAEGGQTAPGRRCCRKRAAPAPAAPPSDAAEAAAPVAGGGA